MSSSPPQFRLFGDMSSNYSVDIYDFDGLDFPPTSQGAVDVSSDATLESLSSAVSPKSDIFAQHLSPIVEHNPSISSNHAENSLGLDEEYSSQMIEENITVSTDNPLSAVISRLSALQQLTQDVVAQLSKKNEEVNAVRSQLTAARYKIATNDVEISKHEHTLVRTVAAQHKQVLMDTPSPTLMDTLTIHPAVIGAAEFADYRSHTSLTEEQHTLLRSMGARLLVNMEEDRLKGAEALVNIREITHRDEEHKRVLQETLKELKEMRRLHAAQEQLEQEEEMDAPLIAAHQAMVSRITSLRFNYISQLYQAYQVESEIDFLRKDREAKNAAHETRKQEILGAIDELNVKLNDLIGESRALRAKNLYRRKR